MAKRFQVSGAGLTDVNGIYEQTGTDAAGNPVYTNTVNAHYTLQAPWLHWALWRDYSTYNAMGRLYMLPPAPFTPEPVNNISWYTWATTKGNDGTGVDPAPTITELSGSTAPATTILPVTETQPPATTPPVATPVTTTTTTGGGGILPVINTSPITPVGSQPPVTTAPPATTTAPPATLPTAVTDVINKVKGIDKPLLIGGAILAYFLFVKK